MVSRKDKMGTQSHLLEAGRFVYEQGYVEGTNTDYPQAVRGDAVNVDETLVSPLCLRELVK